MKNVSCEYCSDDCGKVFLLKAFPSKKFCSTSCAYYYVEESNVSFNNQQLILEWTEQ
jgi:hypothetical protein